MFTFYFRSICFCSKLIEKWRSWEPCCNSHISIVYILATFQFAINFYFIFIYKTNKGIFFSWFFAAFFELLSNIGAHTHAWLHKTAACMDFIAIDICTHTHTHTHIDMFSYVNPQRWQLTQPFDLLLFLLLPLVLQFIACAVRCQRPRCRLRHFAGSQMETTQSRTNDLMKLKCRYFLVDIYCLSSFHLFLLLFSG